MSAKSKLKDYADLLPPEKRGDFTVLCEGIDKSIAQLAEIICDSGPGYLVPLSMGDTKIRIIVYGTATDDDWLRVQAFAALARGEITGVSP